MKQRTMVTLRSGFSSFALFVVSTLTLSVFVGSHLTEGFAANDLEARPFLAVWRDYDHQPYSEAPYLRIAIWNDGRIVFASGDSKWSHELRQGKLDASSLAGLKKAIEATGVFELKGNCYLVPEAPVDCVMIDSGDKQQMLYWDEREMAGCGINLSPKPHHLAFKKCWKEVNQLARAAIPQPSEPYPGQFRRPPQSWRLKKPIQSE